MKIAILAKAPVPGFAKTRLAPVLGDVGAAELQARLIAHTVATARTAGDVTLWVTPDDTHPVFQTLKADVALRQQPDGDLGERMAAAVTDAHGPVLVIGTDCPALTPDHLHRAAERLRSGTDVVITPAEDGGYVLIGMNRLHPELFTGMTWSTPTVMAQTCRRLAALGVVWHEFETLWDVDTPDDLARLRHSPYASLLSG